MSRFVVRELSGYMSDGIGKPRAQGLSVTVLDTAYNHRVVATYRSETRVPIRVPGRKYAAGMATIGRAGARSQAVAHAARLNAAYGEDSQAARERGA